MTLSRLEKVLPSMVAELLGFCFASTEVQDGGITVLGVTGLDGTAFSRLCQPGHGCTLRIAHIPSQQQKGKILANTGKKSPGVGNPPPPWPFLVLDMLTCTRLVRL